MFISTFIELFIAYPFIYIYIYSYFINISGKVEYFSYNLLYRDSVDLLPRNISSGAELVIHVFCNKF